MPVDFHLSLVGAVIGFPAVRGEKNQNAFGPARGVGERLNLSHLLPLASEEYVTLHISNLYH
jgi:hypothetical protein